MFFFFFNDTATTEIYTLSLTRRSSDLTNNEGKGLAIWWPALSCGGSPVTCCFQHVGRSEEHTSELQSHLNLVCRLLLEKKKTLVGAGAMQPDVDPDHFAQRADASFVEQ